MADNKFMSAVTGIVTAGASTGISGFINKLFGGGADKKANNYQNDIQVNSGHAWNWFYQNNKEVYTQQGYDKYLTSDDWEYLASVEIPKVQADPYYGGLGQSYTSKYSGWTHGAVPAVGIARDIDLYIDDKLKTQASELLQAQTPQTATSEDIVLLDYYTQEGKLKKVADKSGNFIYTTTEGQLVATVIPPATATPATATPVTTSTPVGKLLLSKQSQERLLGLMY